MKTARLALILALASACASSPVSPDQPAPVSLTAQIDRAQISSGQTALVTFRLTNTSSQPVTLDFSSGCSLLPFVVKRPSNDIVYPSGGGWVCTAVVMQLVLPPGESTTRELKVVAAASLPDHVTLAPGDYGFYAKLDDRVYQLKSGQVALAVQ